MMVLPNRYIWKRSLVHVAVRLLALGLLFSLLTGCSVRKVAIRKLGDALAQGGSTFASDDDLELVKDSVPFSLKLMESLLAESPRHQGLLFAASSGFAQYTYAFVQQEADEVEKRDVAAATAMRARAKRLYLRARNFSLRGLEVRYPGIAGILRQNPKAALRKVKTPDVALLYWAAVSWGAAISLAKDDPDLIAEQPIVEALIDRALELNEAFDEGAIHTFLITYEMARRGGKGNPSDRSRMHFERAMALSGGFQAAPLVGLAESVAVEQQNLSEFQSLLDKALTISADAKPERRLANLVMQRRARWLLAHAKDLILTSASKESHED